MSSSESESEYAEKEPTVEDSERTAIRDELSSLSFEELQKLKEKIGAKVYNEALFGGKTSEKPERKIKVFKRENKNRPREMSSKIPVSMIPSTNTVSVKKKEVRDPRFDPLCGEFDKQKFNMEYNFLSDIRLQDIKAIKSELKETTDPKRQEKLRRLLQRLNEQHRTSKKNRIEKEKSKLEKESVVKEFREGRQPHFKNKSEQRVEALVKQYEELKKEGTGRIQRHLKRRQQKIKKKSSGTPVDRPSLN